MLSFWVKKLHDFEIMFQNRTEQCFYFSQVVDTTYMYEVLHTNHTYTQIFEGGACTAYLGQNNKRQYI